MADSLLLGVSFICLIPTSFRFIVTVPMAQFSFRQVQLHSVSFQLDWNLGLIMDHHSVVPPALQNWINNAPVGIVQPVWQAPPANGVPGALPPLMNHLFQHGVAVINALPNNVSTNFSTMREGGAKVFIVLFNLEGGLFPRRTMARESNRVWCFGYPYDGRSDKYCWRWWNGRCFRERGMRESRLAVRRV
jgi:hypothetical protein